MSAQTAASKFQSLDSLVNSRMKEMNVPGLSLAVIKKGKVIYEKGYGYGNIELKTAISANSNYLIASVTKTFTAAAAMLLWEQGKFQLDDSIGMYLPELPAHWKPVTIKQLLNHTSGIPTNLEKPDSFCKFSYTIDQYTQENVIQETACLPLHFSPGSKFEYSGRNYFVIGMLIEKLAGKSFEAFLKEKIFIPLAMDETGMIDYSTLVANRVQGYNWQNNVFTNSGQMNPVIEFADGGLISTVEDLEKWVTGLIAGKIVKPATLKMMWSNPVLSDGKTSPYGIGFGLSPYIGYNRIGHTGGIPGFSSCITYFTDADVVVILLSNTYHEGYNVGLLSNQVAAFIVDTIQN